MAEKNDGGGKGVEAMDSEVSLAAVAQEKEILERLRDQLLAEEKKLKCEIKSRRAALELKKKKMEEEMTVEDNALEEELKRRAEEGKKKLQALRFSNEAIEKALNEESSKEDELRAASSCLNAGTETALGLYAKDQVEAFNLALRYGLAGRRASMPGNAFVLVTDLPSSSLQVSPVGNGLALQLDGTPRLEILLAPLTDVRRMCQEGSLPLGASSRLACVAERRVQEEIKRVEESSRSMEGALKDLQRKVVDEPKIVDLSGSVDQTRGPEKRKKVALLPVPSSSLGSCSDLSSSDEVTTSDGRKFILPSVGEMEKSLALKPADEDKLGNAACREWAARDRFLDAIGAESYTSKVLPPAGSSFCHTRAVNPETPDLIPLRAVDLSSDKKRVLFLTDSFGAHFCISDCPRHAFFGSIRGDGLVRVRYPQYDVSYLFDDSKFMFFQFSMAGWAALYGPTACSSVEHLVNTVYRYGGFDPSLKFDYIAVKVGTNDLSFLHSVPLAQYQRKDSSLPSTEAGFHAALTVWLTKIGAAFGSRIIYMGSGAFNCATRDATRPQDFTDRYSLSQSRVWHGLARLAVFTKQAGKSRPSTVGRSWASSPMPDIPSHLINTNDPCAVGHYKARIYADVARDVFNGIGHGIRQFDRSYDYFVLTCAGIPPSFDEEMQVRPGVHPRNPHTHRGEKKPCAEKAVLQAGPNTFDDGGFRAKAGVGPDAYQYRGEIRQIDEKSNAARAIVGGEDVRFELGTRVFLRNTEVAESGPFFVLSEKLIGGVYVCLLVGRTSRKVVKSCDLITG